MAFAVLSFVAVFLLVASGGLLLFYRETLLKRIQDVINPRPKNRSLVTALKQTTFSAAAMVERFESMLPKSDKEVSVLKTRLTRAGYREDSTIKIFYGCKVLTPLVLSVIALATGL